MNITTKPNFNDNLHSLTYTDLLCVLHDIVLFTMDRCISGYITLGLLCYINAYVLNKVDDSLSGWFCSEMIGRDAAVNMFTSALVASLHR